MVSVDAGDRAKQERRRQILSAAKVVFAEAGYHGASIHAIIERAQIARGTFYLYFESKSAVFDSILDQALSDLRTRIRRIEVDDPAAPAPQVQLRGQVVATLEYIVSDRPLALLLLSAGHTPDAEAAGYGHIAIARPGMATMAAPRGTRHHAPVFWALHFSGGRPTSSACLLSHTRYGKSSVSR